MDLDQFTAFADRFVDNEVPPPLLRDLNLGIVVLPEAKEEGEFYIMGEYVTEELGSYIVLYYGSFVEILRGEPRTAWEENIKDTIKHELLHHVEALAGDEKLARQELEAEWERAREQGKTTEKASSSPGFAQKLLQRLQQAFQQQGRK